MKAMLLAAGRGERMRPLTDHTPKPLLVVGGKSLIVWHIEKLVRAGICDIVINHAHLGVQIEAALGNGKQFGARIQYSPETRALETAGGIANALALLDNVPFAVINSDIFCHYDFTLLPERAAALQASGDVVHLVLVDNPEHHPSGDFGLHGMRITNIAPKLTFSGIGIYQPVLFQTISRGSVVPLAPLLREQIACGKASGEHYTGLWADVGTPERLHKLDKQLRATHNTNHD
ncbi:MAG TPA: nucleotidyltransferase family protein [Gallionella sp.]|nr:nucleotidyltransferase family protein [Gallionella sp.]